MSLCEETAWSLLFEEHPCPAWIYDPETLRLLAVNRAAAKAYGHRAGELAGEMSAGGLGMACRPVLYEGRAARLVVVPQVERSEQLLHVVWEQAGRPMRITDVAGTVVSVNQAYERFAGAPRSELEGRPFWILYPKKDQTRIRTHYQERFKRRLLDSVAERLVTLRDGRSAWLELTSSYVETQAGTLLLSILRDVTERRKATEELERARELADAANSAKSAFLANMSHEIRTPMNGVTGMISLVLEKCQDPEAREQLLVAQNAAESLITILNDILDLSKIEAGKMTLEAIDFDLRALFQEALRTFEFPIREKRLELRVSMPQDYSSWVRGDPVRLRQVLVNLLGNAVKFTAAGSVEVNVSKPHAGAVRLEVRDTGIGIPAEKLNSIFDAFTQADASHTRQFGGTGLGLAITRRLVALMGGVVYAESEVGRGSCFVVELPLVCRAAPQRADAPPPEVAVSLPPLDVLVAEDNPINQRVICTMLERQGWKVTLAGNGREALERFRQDRFDLILMDVQMPDVDGLEASRLIREEERCRPADPRRTPIIALTAHAAKQQHEQCLSQGMDAVITKPLHWQSLLAKIGEVLLHCAGTHFECVQKHS